jgi:phosphohistidine phosphatase
VTPPRRVILMRHADAQWPTYAGKDFDRPLTERGESAAHFSASAIQEAGHPVDLILASSARRTQQTAQIVANTLGLPDAAVRLVDALYNASPNTLETQMCQVLHQVNVVLLIAHNPGISELAQRLGGQAKMAALHPAQWLHMTYRAAS